MKILVKTLLAIILLCAPVVAQDKLTWQGLYVGVARTSPVRCFTCNQDLNIEVNAIVGIKKHWNFQVEWIQPLGGRPLMPPIEESVIAPSLIAHFPSPHLPVRDPDDLGRLIPFQSPINRSQDHFLYLHGPLHCGGRIIVWFHPGVLLSEDTSIPFSLPKRTFHLLREADTSYATNKV